MNYFQIVDLDNVNNALLEVAGRIYDLGKAQKLKGVDANTMSMLETQPQELVTRVVRELESCSPCFPVVEGTVSKDDGSERTIYSYSLIDRIKARAIERALLPAFENIYSENLYSYRTGKTAQECARQVVRRYNRYRDKDVVLRADVVNYTDNICQARLATILKALVDDERTFEWLNLFIGNSILRNNRIIQLERGLVQGVGLINQFANLYLSEVDHQIGPRVSMYRRVGDDFFLADSNPDKMDFAARLLKRKLDECDLALNESKCFFGPANETFEYLGYLFVNGKVQIKPNAVQKLIRYYQSRLNWLPISPEQKKKRLNRILRMNRFELHRTGVDFIFSHRFATDSEQIKEISNQFYQILTRFFFRRYSPKNQADVKKLTEHMPIVSLTRIHYLLTNGKATYKSLLVPGTWRYSAGTKKCSVESQAKKQRP